MTSLPPSIGCAGLARGQLVPERRFAARLTAAAVPASGPSATDGFAEVYFSQGQLCWNIMLSNSNAQITSGYLRAGSGAYAAPGTIIVTLFTGSSVLAGCSAATQTAANMTAYYQIRANPTSFYIDLRSAALPNGATRGSLTEKLPLVATLPGGVIASLILGNGGIQYSVQNWQSSSGTLYEMLVSGPAGVITIPLLNLYTQAASLDGSYPVLDQDQIFAISYSPSSYTVSLRTIQSPTQSIEAPLAYSSGEYCCTSLPPCPPLLSCGKL
eukprot:SM002007S05801  [mRNA]  locus=s2007:247:1871:- [translate_table: standard]